MLPYSSSITLSYSTKYQQSWSCATWKSKLTDLKRKVRKCSGINWTGRHLLFRLVFGCSTIFQQSRLGVPSELDRVPPGLDGNGTWSAPNVPINVPTKARFQYVELIPRHASVSHFRQPVSFWFTASEFCIFSQHPIPYLWAPCTKGPLQSYKENSRLHGPWNENFFRVANCPRGVQNK